MNNLKIALNWWDNLMEKESDMTIEKVFCQKCGEPNWKTKEEYSCRECGEIL